MLISTFIIVIIGIVISGKARLDLPSPPHGIPVQGRPPQPGTTGGETEAHLSDFHKLEQLTFRARIEA